MYKKKDENWEDPLSFNISNDHLNDDKDMLCKEESNNISLVSKDDCVVQDESKIQNDNIVAGILCMLLFVLWMTINHVMIKYLMVTHSYISSFDIIYAISITTAIIYYLIGKYQGCNMNLFSFERNLVILIILRAAIGTFCNLLFLLSLSQIIISKAILIFSLNPIFCAILAAIILKEKIHPVTIASCVCATGGIYLLTLKNQEQEDEKSTIFGCSLMVASAILMGAVFVWIRFIFKYPTNVWIINYWTSFGFLIQSIVVHILFPDCFSFGKYQFSDFVFFILISILLLGTGLLMTYASKLTKVSRIAPLGNLENILTILSDVFLFNYSFVITDGIGMFVIFASIGAHI